MYIYTYIYMYVCIYIYIYIYVQYTRIPQHADPSSPQHLPNRFTYTHTNTTNDNANNDGNDNTTSDKTTTTTTTTIIMIVLIMTNDSNNYNDDSNSDKTMLIMIVLLVLPSVRYLLPFPALLLPATPSHRLSCSLLELEAIGFRFQGLGYRDIGIQGHRDIGIQGYRDIGIQGCRDIGIQGYRDRGIEGQRDRGIQGQELGRSSSQDGPCVRSLARSLWLYLSLSGSGLFGISASCRKEPVRLDSFRFRTFRRFIGLVPFGSENYFSRFDAVRPLPAAPRARRMRSLAPPDYRRLVVDISLDISLYIYIYIYMSVCLSVCMYVHMYICTYVCMYVYMNI